MFLIIDLALISCNSGRIKLDTELKTQTDTASKQYQELDNIFISNTEDKIGDKSLFKKEKKKSNLIYNRIIFYSKSDDEKCDSLSFQSKHSYPSSRQVFMIIWKNWLRWKQQN